MTLQTQLIHPETNRGIRGARSRSHYPGTTRLHLPGPLACRGMGSRPVPAPPLGPTPASGSDAHPKPFPASPKLGRNLEPARCPAAPLRCSRAPWPGPCRTVGSPGHGAARAVRSVRCGASRELPGRAEGWQAGGVVPAAIPAAAARPGSRHHEHRRGVPHPAQLPLEQAAGQREAGTEAGDPVPPRRHLLSRFWAHSRPCPR